MNTRANAQVYPGASTGSKKEAGGNQPHLNQVGVGQNWLAEPTRNVVFSLLALGFNKDFVGQPEFYKFT